VAGQEDQDHTAAGPEMPHEDEEGPDDDEGRFFGGGITNDTKDVLDFIDERDKSDSVCLQSLHHHALRSCNDDTEAYGNRSSLAA